MKIKTAISAYQDWYGMRRSAAVEDGLARFLVGVVASPFLVLWDFGKRLGRVVPDTWDQFAFRSFCGRGAFSSGAHFVMGNFEDMRVRDGIKPIAEWSQNWTPSDAAGEVIYGSFSPNAVALLTAFFLRYTGNSLQVTTSAELEHKWYGTLICYGSSEWNPKTRDVATSSAPLCEFVFDENGHRAFEMGEQHYSLEEREEVRYDKAILLRLTNQENPECCYFVCAGLSEWGSLAAVYYLTKNWKDLHKRFDDVWRRKDFCILLEVPYGQFEESKELASNVRLGRSF